MATEKRLIDANAFLDRALKRYTERERGRDLLYTACEVKQNLADMICEAPTVDAVEVVRCKDCKHYLYDDFDGAYVCMQLSKYVKPDFWCAHRERKDNER